jgi:outer membrane protein assembly factor BamB
LLVSTTDGYLVRLDASTGAEQARALVEPLETTAERVTPIRLTAPAVGGGVAVVAATDGYVRAFNLETLTPVWSHAFAEGLSAAPVVAGAHVFVATLKGVVAALPLGGGAPVWTAEVRGRVKSALAAIDGRLFVLSEPRHLTAFGPTP